MQTNTNHIYVAEKISKVKYKPMYSALTYERAEQTLEVLQQLHEGKNYVIICTRKEYDVLPRERIRLFDFA